MTGKSIKIVLFILALASLISAHKRNIDPHKKSFCGKRADQSCILFADLTEGPYYVHAPVRQNIKETQSGVPLRLYFDVRDIETCEPLANAAVEIWHCSALGVYSAFQNTQNQGGTGTTFLRGLQAVNSTGGVTFDTIFPGWYTGRDTHIHLKVHVNGTTNSTGYFSGGKVAHVGQMFFEESLLDKIAEISPYNTNTAQMTPQSQDNIFQQAGTDALMPYYQVDSSDLSKGLVAWITVGVNTSLSISSTADGGSADNGGNTMNGGGPNQPPVATSTSSSTLGATSAHSTSSSDSFRLFVALTNFSIATFCLVLLSLFV
eukprot:TRINITY_DN6896_c0_g1_i1.p1 TRINITY_DN6896_c0_g1~~TRINITY_DN6896_c0_g1_i1.p1  ORF type:complete len:318 (+),score=84.60 TRINITY_DN6896_c0_g1_i1:1558-2511(+)